MADKRAFAKFDVGYLDNPKMMDILDASCSAILMHFASVLYCAQHLTDGVVASKAMQRKTGGTDDDVNLLIEKGLWHEPGHDCDSCAQPPAGKVYVHDFLEHNREAAEAKRVSKKRSDAAKVRWDRQKEDMQIALQANDVCNAERERERENNTPSKSSSDSAEFETFWAEYPRKVGKIAAQKAFTKALNVAPLDQITQALAVLRQDMRGKDPRFIPHPATWLNEGRWDDEPPQAQPTAGTPWSKEFHQ